VLRAVNRGGDGAHVSLTDPASAWRLGRAFGFYVERLLVPAGFQAYVPEVPSGAVTVLFALVGIAAVVLTCAPGLLARRGAAAQRAWRSGDPRVRFAVLWMVLTLAPSMTVVLADISVTPVAERYLYLPSVGLALLVGLALTRRPAALRQRAAGAAVVAVLVLLAIATVVRNRVWHDELSLWSDVTAKERRWALPHMNLGLALADAGRLDEAETAYRAALAARASPTTTRDVHVNFGHLQLRRGQLDEALALFTRANAMAPHASAYYGLGAVHRTQARAALERGDERSAMASFARAREALDAALAINDRHYKSHFLLASVLYQTRDLPGALSHYRRVVEIAPDTDLGHDAGEAASQLAAWLADPANRRTEPAS
jgi:tetratricopeptide (TPR) repeat protein